MASAAFAAEAVRYLDASPTPYHAVSEGCKMLQAAGFTYLSERQAWRGNVVPGGRYFYTRNQSTLVAFTVGEKFLPGGGFKLVGAHTDSPNLKVKPVSDRTVHGFSQVGVETYGGGLCA